MRESLIGTLHEKTLRIVKTLDLNIYIYIYITLRKYVKMG